MAENSSCSKENGRPGSLLKTEEPALAPTGNASTTHGSYKNLGHMASRRCPTGGCARPGEPLAFIVFIFIRAPWALASVVCPFGPSPSPVRPALSKLNKEEEGAFTTPLDSSLEHDLRRVPRPSPPTSKRAGKPPSFVLCVQLGSCLPSCFPRPLRPQSHN